MNEFEIIDGVLVHYHGHDASPVLPQGIHAIGEGAFRDCRELTDLTIPDGVREIGIEAFQWCSNLKTVAAPDSITLVGRDAFSGTPYYKYYCENETTWKEDFLFLGKCLLKARRNLRTARIPDGTVSISSDAFFERVLLSEVHIPDSVMDIGWRAFSDCTGLTSIHIPASVKCIGWHCFKGCTRLRHITFEEGIETIENGVFSGCRSLTNITFPASIKQLNSWMFFGCNNLHEVHFSGPITSIGDWTFSGCSTLEHVDFTEGLESIGVDAFYECITLKEAPLPDSLKEIKRRAFYGCRYIPEIHLPTGLNSLGDSAFFACRNVESLNIPGTLKIIPEDCFGSCDKLQSVIMQPGIHSINARAFAYCFRLADVCLPSDHPIDIGIDIFDGCASLADSEGFIILDQVCYGSIQPTSHLHTPEGVTAISDNAFREKPYYRTVTLSDDVTFIGKKAFFGCENLQHAYIPERVKDLPLDCFNGCDSLTILTILGIAPYKLDAHLRIPAALGYCRNAAMYTPEMISQYEHFISEHTLDILIAAIDGHLSDCAAYFTEKERIPKDIFSSVLEKAQQTKSMEIVALLLEYRSKYMTTFNQFDFFEL